MKGSVYPGVSKCGSSQPSLPNLIHTNNIIGGPQYADEKSKAQRVFMSYHSFISQETKAQGHRRLALACPASTGQR